MIKLYLDFDGVILDTITVTYRIISDKKIITEEEKRAFYSNLDWNYLLKTTPQINDSIDCIKKIIATNLFDVKILTHITSEAEGIEKRKFIKDLIPELEVITVLRGTEKCDAVDPTDAILIDDYLFNLELWEKKGGIAVKFSDSGKISPYLTIKKLDEVITLVPEIKKKVRV